MGGEDKRPRTTRRVFLRGTATVVPAVAAGGASLMTADAAWAAQAANLKPGTMVVLAKLARDIFPHDRVPDRFYVAAVWPYDAKAGRDTALRALLEDGAAKLDAAAGRFGVRGGYVALDWERDRLPLVQGMAATPSSGSCGATSWSSFYNQQELWPRFGYEGSSFEQGGYLERGFDDIDWLRSGVGALRRETWQVRPERRRRGRHHRLRRRRRHARQRVGAEGRQGRGPGGGRPARDTTTSSMTSGPASPSSPGRTCGPPRAPGAWRGTSRTCRPGS